MARKSYPGGWSIYKLKSAPKKPWKAENNSGVDRVRFGFAAEQEAIDYVTIAYRLSRDKDKPFLSLPPGDKRWSILQTLAEQILPLKCDSAEMDEWQSLIHAKPGTRKTLHLMKPRIDYCLDRHKPEFMATALFDKLSFTRSSFTVQEMVDARRKHKENLAPKSQELLGATRRWIRCSDEHRAPG